MKQLWEKIVALAGSNFGLKALALTIAAGLWVAGHRDIERSIEVPVEFRNIPGDLMVMDNRVDFVVLRVTGPRTLVSTIDADEMKLLLDLNSAKPGSLSYPLGGSLFNIPRGVTVARITPPVVHLRMEPVIKLTLPVSVRIAGKPAAGFRIAQTTVQPARVTVQGTGGRGAPSHRGGNRAGGSARNPRCPQASGAAVDRWQTAYVLARPGGDCRFSRRRAGQPRIRPGRDRHAGL